MTTPRKAPLIMFFKYHVTRHQALIMGSIGALLMAFIGPDAALAFDANGHLNSVNLAILAPLAIGVLDSVFHQMTGVLPTKPTKGLTQVSSPEDVINQVSMVVQAVESLVDVVRELTIQIPQTALPAGPLVQESVGEVSAIPALVLPSAPVTISPARALAIDAVPDQIQPSAESVQTSATEPEASTNTDDLHAEAADVTPTQDADATAGPNAETGTQVILSPTQFDQR